jgi:2-oxoglutarate dehydrogenase E1 component
MTTKAIAMKDINGLSGVNAALTASLAERFLANPDQVQEPWRSTFAGLPREALVELAGPEAVAVWEARRDARNGNGNGRAHAPAAPDPRAAMGWQVADQLRLDWAVARLVETYRDKGHLHAAVNPLRAAHHNVKFDYRAFGISDADLERPARADVPLPAGAKVRDLIALLEDTYCRTVGVELAHVEDEAERLWLRQRVEAARCRPQMNAAKQRWLLERLTEATLLEQFLGRKFLGAKRFSVEGGETTLPLLFEMIYAAAQLGAREVVMGMAHRGRLNVMINLLKMEQSALFAIFQDEDELANLGKGDVKYHRGQSHDLETPAGHKVHVSLCFNPSHLEFVNPVVLGRARAKQERLGAGAAAKVLPLMIHGDAAVVGQGIVAESLNLAGLEGYSTGGALHLVINNQVGFTTDPDDSRTTRYATDIARWFGVPVFHVNGEDPEAALFAAGLAAEYRQTFGKDVFVDLICYRLHGHNEGDEPRYTQPAMYQQIGQHKPPRDLYRDQLLAQGVLTQDDDKAIQRAWTQQAEQALEASRKQRAPAPPAMGGVWKGYTGGPDADTPESVTGIERERLQRLLRKLTQPPAGFQVNPKLEQELKSREAMLRGDRPLDWSAGEVLAFASLLEDGATLRISGQDSQRGTFSHRHVVLHDTHSGAKWRTVDNVAPDPARFGVWNSPLSEAAVLGFDYGYSLDRPDALTIWEAQFGDFANGAQVLIDQFIASGEDKWSRLSGLVMLLPHGYEGQGPEHSSARLERFLNLCAEDNMQVCYPTTPAQLFHLLRRQVARPWRKPLVIMSPKSLLRHPMVASSLDDLTTGTFQRILGDEPGRDPKAVTQVLMCAGRVYYDLATERDKHHAQDTALLRFEQLYPLSPDAIRAALSPYAGASRFAWVQDEPWNMGAWGSVQAQVREAMGANFPLRVVCRAASASPATGSHASHKYEAKRLVEVAFGAAQDPNGAVIDSAV